MKELTDSINYINIMSMSLIDFMKNNFDKFSEMIQNIDKTKINIQKLLRDLKGQSDVNLLVNQKSNDKDEMMRILRDQIEVLQIIRN